MKIQSRFKYTCILLYFYTYKMIGAMCSNLLSDPSPKIPVIKIDYRGHHGRRTKDILGGPKGWGPKKKVANIEIYVIFEVFAFCGRRTKTDFKDRAPLPVSTRWLHFDILDTLLVVPQGQRSVGVLMLWPWLKTILPFCLSLMQRKGLICIKAPNLKENRQAEA